MARHHLFAGVVLLAVISGILSPYLQVVVLFAPLWLPIWLPPTPSILFFLSSLITATTVLLVSGVPAALAEAVLPGIRGTDRPLYIWLGGAAVLSLPALLRLVG